jgi:hypothetical protein
VEGFGIDLHAWADLLGSLDNDALSRFNAFVNDPIVAERFAESHLSNAHLVIATDNGQLPSTLEIEDRLLRNEQRSLFDLCCRSYSAVLAWAQNIAGIRE